MSTPDVTATLTGTHGRGAHTLGGRLWGVLGSFGESLGGLGSRWELWGVLGSFGESLGALVDESFFKSP